MSSLQEHLRKIPWKSLKHAYGIATDTPMHLLALLSEDEGERDNALERLWNSLCHQGSVCEASAAAAPLLIQILEQVSDEQKPSLLELLDGLAVGSKYAGRNLARLTMVDTSHQRWQTMGQFLQEGNSFHIPGWMESSHVAVGTGIPVFLSLLQSTNKETISTTLNLLAAFQELNQEIVPALMTFISEVDDATLKALALKCLGDVLGEQAPEWELYTQLFALPADQLDSSVRMAAAKTFAKYHPHETTPEMIDILVENMLKPYALDLYVLSLLGVPGGWQALIRLLEQGTANWNLLDTMRVAEAVLDMVFFGAWVEDRCWNYRSNRFAFTLLTAHEITDGEPADSAETENLPDLWEGDATYLFHYGMTSTYPPQPDDLLISVWGYDKDEAQALTQRFEQEGVQALSIEQKEALRVVLHCEPLWQYRHNLMEIYGLPIKQHKLTAFMLGEKTA